MGHTAQRRVACAERSAAEELGLSRGAPVVLRAG